MSLFDVKGEVHLRPYQVEAIERIAARAAAGVRRILLVLSTGGGKSVIAGKIIADAVACGQRVLVVAHRRELIQQLYAKTVGAGVASPLVGVLMAGDPRRSPGAPVQVASIDTLRHRARPRA